MAHPRNHSHDKEELFRELYEAYYAPLCLYAYRFTRERGGMSAAEDIVADIFAALWDRLPELELLRDTAGAYLHSAVRNRCLNHLKHRLYELSYTQNCQGRDPVYATAPDALYTLEELYGLLRRTLEAMPEQYRTVFVKSIVEGRTQEEIAREMNLSIKTVGRYKQRTLEELRRRLSSYLPLMLALGVFRAEW